MIVVLAVPLAVAFTLSVLRSTAVIPEQTRISTLIGQSTTVLREQHPAVARHDIEQALANGPAEVADAVGRPVRVFPEVDGLIPTSARGRQVSSFGFGIDLDEPIHRGRFQLDQGVAARATGEVVLSRAVAERLEVGVGDEVAVGDSGTPARVTGIAVQVTDITRQFVVVTPPSAARLVRAIPTDDEATLLPGQQHTEVLWHTTEPVDAGAVAQGWRADTREQILGLLSRESAQGEDKATPLILGVTVLVLAELGLVLGATYSIVVRGNRRELGLLAVAGAEPKVRRTVITYQGLLVGLVATALAGTIGVLAAWPMADVVAARHYEVWGSLRLDPIAVVVLVTIGIATPASAARMAARGVRVDVVAALRDQDEPVSAAHRRGLAAAVAWLVAGTVTIAAGIAAQAIYLVMFSALVLLIGVGLLVARLLPALTSRGESMRLLPRLGLRVARRGPGRTVALATGLASLTVVGGLTLVAMGGLTEQIKAGYVPMSPSGSVIVYTTRAPQPATIAAMAEAFGVDRMVGLGLASPPPPPGLRSGTPPLWGGLSATGPCSPAPGSQPASASQQECASFSGVNAVMVVNEVDLDRVLGRAVTARERQAMAEGHALVLDQRLAARGVLTVSAPDTTNSGYGRPDAGPPEFRTIELPAVVAQDRSPYRQLPLVYVSAAGLTELGAVVQPDAAFFYAPVPADSSGFSAEQEDRARAALAADIGPSQFQLNVERGPAAVKIYRATTAAAVALLALVAATLAFVTVTLATQEIRSDLSALAAAGAGRRLRSWLSAWHAEMAMLLGVGMGLTVTVATTPAVLAVLDIGWTPWPLLGLLAASAAALVAAMLAGIVAGARVATLLRRTDH